MHLAISHFEGTFYNNSMTLAQPSNLYYSFPLLKSVEYYLDTIFFPYQFCIFVSPSIQQVLRLLKVAWERKLTFAIGTSVTTGATDTLVWNEIHHKTESTSNYSGHGYPDPNYLDNVLMELAAQGVEDKSDPVVINISSDSDSDL